MLVFSNYAKNYASTIYSSLVETGLSHRTEARTTATAMKTPQKNGSAPLARAFCILEHLFSDLVLTTGSNLDLSQAFHDYSVLFTLYNSWISHDVTAAMLVSPNNEMAAMLVSRSNPPGIESYYYANVFFCFR